MGEDDGEVYELTPEEEADREIERGEVVGEEEVRTILAKYLR